MDEREFLKSIISDDDFVGLTSSAQALYLHMFADSHWTGTAYVCTSTTVAMFKAHATQEDYEILQEFGFIKESKSGGDILVGLEVMHDG